MGILLLLASGCSTVNDDDAFYIKQRFPAHARPVLKKYTTENLSIQYAEIGNPAGPLVLFIHGSPGNWRTFHRTLNDRELQEQYHMVAVDRPGYGASDKGNNFCSLQHQAKLLLPLIRDQYPDRKIILVGHSYGGPIAVWMALEQPQNIDGLILVAPALNPNLENSNWYQLMAQKSPIRWLIPKDHRTANDEILKLKSELTELLPFWKSLNVPVIHIHGARDKLVSISTAGFLKKEMRAELLQTVELPRGNHFIPWNNAEIIKQSIIDISER